MHTILDLDDHILIPLIVKELTFLAKTYEYGKLHSELKEDNHLVIQDIHYKVWGNDCWGNEEQYEHTNFKDFTIDHVVEFFNNLILDEQHIHSKLHEHPDYVLYLNYYSNYHISANINETITTEDYDYYGNYNQMKSFNIDINSVLQNLRTIPFKKEISKITDVFVHCKKKDLNKIVQFDKINTNLHEKNLPSKKYKI